MRRILIALFIVVLLVVGLFVINYVPSLEQTTQRESAISLELTKNIVDQMFPGSKYSIKDGMIYFSTQIPANYQTLYLEQIRNGSFMGDKGEYFAVLRAPDSVTVHAGGFYYAIGAIFDAETNIIKSKNKDFVADEGEISILNGRNRNLILFLGSSTFQGYTTPTGGIYDISKGYWEQTWPEDSDFWHERYAVFGNNRLVLYKKVFEPVNYETSEPLYHFEPEREMFWDSETETFREPLR